MTFVSDDVTKELNKYSFSQRCKILVELADNPLEDADFEDFFEFGSEAVDYASGFLSGEALTTEEMEVVTDQFRLYILISNGWHR